VYEYDQKLDCYSVGNAENIEFENALKNVRP